ncbi:NifB/NifX family molybdenum-iron cluster-binding protein [Desulfosediminicola ganghwensis]|uniref:NifB/NifX family molybdenum-iron cluster-binding protein n=1 Tax=Desulfosediminicola ganghwensis TaxID=2569540 RepID=UPI0010AC02F6|nr:NifB/NifX family molybdenum-iron cluster-binding protein [Desulfosediminicola ganghwensis]
MKVAVTVWGKRISPVFDAASTLLIVEVDNGVQRGGTFLKCICENTAGVIRTLRAADIEVLITGAICREAADSLEAAGVRLIPFVAGRVDHVLADFLEGKSLTGCRMPGWCGGRNGRSRKCRGR